jgi:hypothetical protein
MAETLRSSKKTILRRIAAGTLPASKQGGRWLFEVAAIRAALIAGLLRPKSAPSAPSSSPACAAAALGHAVEILRQIAKYHAGCAPAHVKAIADWGKTVRPHYNSMTRRNRALLAKVTVPATLQRLLALPKTLRDEVTDAGSGFRAQVAAQRAAAPSDDQE